jgi:hypothetical protein
VRVVLQSACLFLMLYLAQLSVSSVLVHTVEDTHTYAFCAHIQHMQAARIHALAQEHIDEFNPHSMAFKEAEALASRGITV